MARKRRRNYHGIAEPVHVREPLLVRLAATFVENLTLMLKTALVVGAVILVHDLRTALKEVPQPVTESVPRSAPPVVIEEIVEIEAQETVLSDGVKHAFNCTFEDYRNAHYDDCVKEPSSIYVRPNADPDNTGLVFYDAPVLYARLDKYTRPE